MFVLFDPQRNIWYNNYGKDYTIVIERPKNENSIQGLSIKSSNIMDMLI